MKKTSQQRKALSSVALSSILLTSVPITPAVAGGSEAEQRKRGSAVTQEAEKKAVNSEFVQEKETNKVGAKANEEQAALVSGLLGYYFTEENFNNLSYIQESKTGTLSVERKQNIKSIYWHGYVQTEKEGAYTFTTSANSNMIVTVNGEKVINRSDETKTITLEKNVAYEIDIQLVHPEGMESVQLAWTTPDGKKETLSAKQLLLPNADVENVKQDKGKRTRRAVEDTTPGKVRIGEVNYSDHDRDGIPDSWEKNGYTVETTQEEGVYRFQIAKWEEAKHARGKVDILGKPFQKFISDPDRRSTTGDPYSDYDKVMSNYKTEGNLDASILPEARNPLVAAVPNIKITVEDFSVGAVEAVQTTDSKNKLQLKSTSRQSGSISTSGWNVSLGFEGKTPTGSIGYDSSTTTINTMEVAKQEQEEKGWQHTIGLNTGARAYAYGAVRYYNNGTAPMYKFVPTVTIGLPKTENYPNQHDMIATLNGKSLPGQQVSALPPNQTKPDMGTNPLFFSDFSDYKTGSISLLSSQFERFEKDRQLSIDLVNYQGSITGSTAMAGEKDWSHYITQVEALTARLLFVLPGQDLERRVVGKGSANTPEVSLEEAIALVSPMQKIKDSNRYEAKIGVHTYTFTIRAFLKGSTDAETLPDIKLKPNMDVKIVPDGWVQEDGKNAYYYKGGKLVTGPEVIDDTYYQFDSTGKFVKEMTKPSGFVKQEKNGRKTTHYYRKAEDTVVGATGVELNVGEMAKDSVYTIHRNTYMFGKEGEMLTGFQPSGNQTYYYEEQGKEKGVRRTGWITRGEKEYYLDPENNGAVVQATWKTILDDRGRNKRTYFDANGVLVFQEGATYQLQDASGQFAIGQQEGTLYLQSKDRQSLSQQWVFEYDENKKSYRILSKIDKRGWERKMTMWDGGDDVVLESPSSEWEVLLNNNVWTLQLRNSYRLKQLGTDVGVGTKLKVHSDRTKSSNIKLQKITNGLYIKDGKTYGVDPDGKTAKRGFQNVDGHTYYFGAPGDGIVDLHEGEMALGWQTIAGKDYYLRQRGDGLNDFEVGERVTGERNIDGKRCVFKETGELLYKEGATYHILSQKDGSKSIRADENHQVVLWENDRKADKQFVLEYDTTHKAYRFVSKKESSFVLSSTEENYGNIGRSVMVVSRNLIDRKQLWEIERTTDGYFLLKNKSDLNKILDIFGGHTSNGAKVGIFPKSDADPQRFKLQEVKNGWQNKGMYYFDEKGIKKNGWQEIDGKRYYFGKENDGSVLALGRKATGWQKINGKTYYFKKTGDDLQGFDEGENVTGWQKDKNGRCFYFGTGLDGLKIGKGEMAIGWQEIEGKRYYFSQRGDGLADLKQGELASGWQTIQGKKYYLNEKGECVTGWHTLTRDGVARRYYFGSAHDGSELAVGEQASGWRDITGKRYYFSTSGDGLVDLKQGQLATGWRKIENKKYYFHTKEDGLQGCQEGEGITGWQTLTTEGKARKYYFSQPGDRLSSFRKGELVTGFQTLLDPANRKKKTEFYFGEDNTTIETGLAVGEVATGWKKVSHRVYLFDERGKTALEENAYYISNADVPDKRVYDNYLYYKGEYKQQRWYFEYDSTKQAYRIKNANDLNKSLAWTSGAGDNSVIMFENKDDHIDQFWIPTSNVDGTFVFQNKMNPNKILDLNPDKTYLRVADKDATKRSQSFTLRELSAGTDVAQTQRLADGMYEIESKLGADKLVTGESVDGVSNVSLIGKKDEKQTQQMWHFSYVPEKKAYQIATYAKSGFLSWIDSNTSSRNVGTGNKEEGKYWMIEDAAGGYFKLRNRYNSTFVLDVFEGRTDDGTNIGVHEYNGGNGQQFTFRPIQTGWQVSKVGGNTAYSYYDEKGDLVKGEHKLKNEEDQEHTYYFDTTGIMMTGFQDLTRREGQTERTDTYYFNPQGELEPTDGFRVIDGKRYYFTGGGRRMKKSGWINIPYNAEPAKKSWYYMDNTTGEIAVSRIIQEGTDTYYVDADGKRVEGGFRSLLENQTTKTYYFGTDGKRKNGVQIIDKKVYAFDETTGDMRKGSQEGTIVGRTERITFGSDGALRIKNPTLLTVGTQKYGVENTGNEIATVINGWKEIKNKKYYFGKPEDGTSLTEGEMAIGFYTIKDRNNKMQIYYFGKQTDESPFTEGQMATGSCSIKVNKRGEDNKSGTYYFDSEGKAQTGIVIDGNSTYIHGKDGVRLRGQWEKINHKTYYAEGTYGQMVTGWEEINRKWYYFGTPGDSTGLEKGEMATGRKIIGGTTYYFGKLSDGTGLTEGQKAQEKKVTVGENMFYFQNDGSLYIPPAGPPGALAHSLKVIAGKTYYFKNDGSIFTSGMQRTVLPFEIARDIERITIYRYFGTGTDNLNLEKGEMAVGRRKLNNIQYYFGKNGDGSALLEGEMARGQTYMIDGHPYRFDAEGRVITSGGKSRRSIEDETKQEVFFYHPFTEEPRKNERIGVQYGEEKYLISTDGEGRVRVEENEGNEFVNAIYKNQKPKPEDGEEGIDFETVEGLELLWDSHQMKDGSTYYFEEGDEDGKEEGRMLTGLQELPDETDGKLATYYFGDDGKMRVGLTKVKQSSEPEELYIFDAKGKAQTGVIHYEGKTYIATEKGTLLRGKWHQQDQKWYYSDPSTGQFQTGFQHIEGKTYYFDQAGVMQTGFVKVNGKTFYFGKKGESTDLSLQEGEMAKGYVRIGTIRYLFGTKRTTSKEGLLEGEMITGWSTHPAEGKNYFGKPGDGTGLKEGELAEGLFYIEGQTYTFNPWGGQQDAGSWHAGWNWNGSMYYYTTADTEVTGWKAGRMVKGTDMTLQGKTFRFTNEGKLEEKDSYWYVTKENSQGALQYYYNQKGRVKSWKEINQKWYYFHPETNVMQTGLQTIQGKQYYLGKPQDGTGLEEGEMAQNRKVTVAGMNYEFDTDGAAEAIHGWQTIAGHTYYYENGEKVTGVFVIEKRAYLFDENGVMQTGWHTIPGVSWRVNFLSDGKMEVTNGSYWISAKHKKYYIENDGKGTGAGQVVTGWKQIDQRWYYFNPTDTSMQTGLQTIDGKQYYLGKPQDGTGLAEGEMAHNRKITVDGVDYHFAGDGVATKATNGWQTSSGQTYYYENGNKIKGVTVIEKRAYLFDENGVMQTGWHTIPEVKWSVNFLPDGKMEVADQSYWIVTNDNKYFYIENDGTSVGHVVPGWKEINGKSYYFLDTGERAVGLHTIMKNGSAFSYYFQATGEAFGGEQNVQEKRFYGDSFGVLQERNTYWYYENEKYYYVENGYVKGWKQINNRWYYFDQETGVMQTGLQTIDGKKYYLGKQQGDIGLAIGEMAQNKEVKIEEKTYQANQMGVLR